jgi:phage terminase large subunit-like protein
VAVAVAPRWAAYAAGSDIDDFREFCAEHLVQSKDRWAGEPLLLEPFQVEMMGEALAYGEDGLPIWNRVVILMPRKNGKTELLAAYALFHLLTSVGQPSVALAASSDGQAKALFDAASLYVRNSPALSQLLRIRDHNVAEIIREDGGGKIERLSSDPRRLHGKNPSLVVLDELAQWTTPQLEKAHAALTSAGGARTAPQTFTITTAGEARYREDSILGRILDDAVARGDVEDRPGLTIARHFDAKLLVFNHEAPTTDPHDVEKMKLANPASWITEEFLRGQAADPELTDSDVLQLHGGVWAAGESSWLPAGLWRECELSGRPPVAPGTEMILAFDGSYNRDSTALVGCTLEPRPFIWVVGVWERPEGARDDWVVPREEVKARLADAMTRWRVLELVCDPPGWHAEIEEWSELYAGTLTLMFSTNRRQLMANACSKFYSALVERNLTHDGDNALARHLANAVVKATPEGKYITKDHPDSPHKIDLAVAAVVAFDRATQQRYDGPLIDVLV